MTIELEKQTRDDLLASLKRYMSEEFDEELGDLRAGLFLDYLLSDLGSCVYNQAIRDAQAWFQDRTLDLDGSCYKQEFQYWPEQRGK